MSAQYSRRKLLGSYVAERFPFFGGASLAEARPNLDRTRPYHWADVDQTWAEFKTNIGQSLWQLRPEHDRVYAECVARSGPSSAVVSQTWPEFGRCSTKSGPDSASRPVGFDKFRSGSDRGRPRASPPAQPCAPPRPPHAPARPPARRCLLIGPPAQPPPSHPLVLLACRPPPPRPPPPAPPPACLPAWPAARLLTTAARPSARPRVLFFPPPHGRTVGCAPGRPAGRARGLAGGRAGGRAVGRSGGRGRSDRRAVGRSVGRSHGRPAPTMASVRVTA